MRTIRVNVLEDDVKLILDILEDEEARCRTQIHVQDGEYTEAAQKHWIKRLEVVRKAKGRVTAWRKLLR